MTLPKWELPPENLQLTENQIDLWLIDLNPADFEVDHLDRSQFAVDELERAARFRFDRHRRRYLVGRLGLRQVLSRYLAIKPAEVEFVYGEFGKPSLKTNPVGIEFNLSNSHELALVGVCGEVIGADLEHIDRKMWDIDALAQTVFTEQEISELNRYPAEQKLQPFLCGWTRKEAYLKAIGKGLALPLKEFSVELRSDADHPAISAPDWSLFSFWANKDYPSAVAYPSAQTQPRFRWFRLPESLLG